MPGILLGFAGDFCLAAANGTGSGYCERIFSVTRQLTGLTDWSMANLEFCIRPDGWDSVSRLSIPEALCDGIAKSGFSAFGLANNHILDDGPDVLEHTVRFLRNRGLQVSGAGSNLEGARAPLQFEVKGVRICVISATDATHCAATARRPGVAPLSGRRLLNQVRQAATDHDLVIVNLHADLEFSNSPAPWKVRLSRRLVENGANVVVHHHPHTLQGLEYHRGSVIAYSLGSLVFPMRGSRYMANRPGNAYRGVFLLLSVDIDEPRKHLIKHTFIPTYISDQDVLRVVTGTERVESLAALERYADYLKDGRLLRKLHFERCRHETLLYLKGMYYALRKEGIRGCWEHTAHPLTTRMARHGLIGALTAGYF